MKLNREHIKALKHARKQLVEAHFSGICAGLWDYYDGQFDRAAETKFPIVRFRW